MFRGQFDRFSKGVQGRNRVATGRQNGGEIAPELDQVRLQIDGPTEGGDGLVGSAESMQGVAKIAVGLGESWHRGGRFGDQVGGGFRISGLERHDAEEVIGVRIRGLSGEDLSIDPFRLGPPSHPLESESPFEQRLDLIFLLCLGHRASTVPWSRRRMAPPGYRSRHRPHCELSVSIIQQLVGKSIRGSP